MNKLIALLNLLCLAVVIVLVVLLVICKGKSSENLCVCQGEGQESCRDRAKRAAAYNAGDFKPQFSGV